MADFLQPLFNEKFMLSSGKNAAIIYGTFRLSTEIHGIGTCTRSRKMEILEEIIEVKMPKSSLTP